MYEVINEDKERSQWRHPDVFIANCEHFSHLFLMFLLLTFSMYVFAGLDEYSTA